MGEGWSYEGGLFSGALGAYWIWGTLFIGRHEAS